MKKKILLIVILIISVLAVAGTVLGYLYIATDTFKSDQELFAKYMTQDIEMIQNLTDLQTIKVYENLKNENKYNSNTKIEAVYSEGGEISNPINDLSATIDIQKDKENEYSYVEGKILHAEEKYLEAEFIKQGTYYGIRLPNVITKFLAIEKKEDFEKVASESGIDSKQLNRIIEILDQDETNLSITEDKVQRYLQIIYDNLIKGTFSSVKDEINSYTVQLNEEQVKTLVIELLNNIKLEKISENEEVKKIIDEKIKTMEEKEIPEIKLTVYEEKGKVLKTVIEIDAYIITMQNKKENEETKVIIQITNSDNEQVKQYNIEMSKKNGENKENFEIVLNVIEGEEDYTITLVNEMQLNEQEIKLNSSIRYEKDILTIGLTLANEIDINTDFEKIYTLKESNYVVLNDLQPEIRVAIISQLKEKATQKAQEKLEQLSEKLGLKQENEETQTEENQMPQAEINKFNAKFEFFTGNKVSAESIHSLLEVVKNNLVSYELVPIENESEEQSDVQQDVKYKIKLNIEKDKMNEVAANEVIAKIEYDKKYDITISYKQGSGLIDYIIIKEVEE